MEDYKMDSCYFRNSNHSCAACISEVCTVFAAFSRKQIFGFKMNIVGNANLGSSTILSGSRNSAVSFIREQETTGRNDTKAELS